MTPHRNERTTGNSAKIAVVALALIASCVHADITPGSDWNSAPYDPWTNYWGYAPLNVGTTGGNTGGWLQVTFTNTSSFPGPSWNDIAYTKATNIIVGAWTTNTAIRFDFWQSNVVASGVSLDFASTNGDIWTYSLTPSGVLTNWTTYTVSFNDIANWNSDFPVDSYLNDLSSIDWIGIQIYRDTSSQQVYGIDNVMLSVPEPAECVLLGAAIIAAGMSLRKKRRLREDIGLLVVNSA